MYKIVNNNKEKIYNNLHNQVNPKNKSFSPN